MPHSCVADNKPNYLWEQSTEMSYIQDNNWLIIHRHIKVKPIDRIRNSQTQIHNSINTSTKTITLDGMKFSSYLLKIKTNLVK